ncbi:MAG: hypothetical protein EBR59_07365, partial [Methylococcaceae bacterium]|nr:hypothetical protein [Methylococcaceae bacterium]
MRFTIRNDGTKEGPESLRLIATDDVLGSVFGSCVIRDDGSGSVWLGDGVTPKSDSELSATGFKRDDDFDQDGIEPNVEEILATMSASTGKGGKDGDLNADGIQDADQNSVSTFAWIKSSYFDDALAGNLTQVKPIVYLAAEASSSSAKADLEYQLSGIKVKTLTAPEFGGTSAIKITNSLTDTVVNAWDPLLFHISAISGSGSSGLHDCDALRAGTQVTAYIDVSRANVSVTDLNA